MDGMDIDPSENQAEPKVKNLPTELLLVIFRLVYVRGLVSTSILTLKRGRVPATAWNEADDINSPTLFPYALASVCTRWREIMGTVPEFWTRIVIHTDSLDFSLPFIRSQFHWSRELPLDIMVGNKYNNVLGYTPDVERERVRGIFDIMRPHIRRCKTIVYDLFFTCSLPCAATDFHGDAPLLKELELIATEATGFGGSLMAERDNMNADPFTFPALNTLALDGWNFVNLIANAPHWVEQLSTSTLDSLNITHYEQTGGGPAFRFNDAWPIFRRTTSLSLDNVYWDGELFPHVGGDPLEDYYLEVLQLCDLSGPLTAVVLSHPPFIECLEIMRCPLGNVRSLETGFFLTLDDIDNPKDIRELLVDWPGGDLTVHDCEGFDDSVLDMLGTPNFNKATRLRTFNAESLTSLRFRGECYFTVAALRKMLEHRLTVEEFRYPTVNGPNNHTKLHSISGNVELYMSEEDRAWFSANLTRFEWR